LDDDLRDCEFTVEIAAMVKSDTTNCGFAEAQRASTAAPTPIRLPSSKLCARPVEALWRRDADASYAVSTA